MAKRCKSCCTVPTAAICPTVTGCSVPVDGTSMTITYKGIDHFTVTSGGTGYTSAPTVLIGAVGPTGSGGSATAVINGSGVVTSITLNAAGRYSSAPTISFSGGGGSGATATASMTGDSTLGTCTTTGQVASCTVTNNGTNYTSAPTLTLSGGGSPTTTATATANLGLGFVSALSLDSAGSGYTSPPTVAFSPTGATATSRLTATTLASVSITSRGGGFTGNPSVSITGGGGTGATASATIGPVTAVGATAGGSGYTTATASFSGGGGSGAAATANIVAGAVTSYTITNNGSGYTSNPTVSVAGDGSGATASATATPGALAAITVTAAGSGFTTLPTIGVSGGGGGGTSQVAVLTATTVGSLVLGSAGNAYPFPTTLIVTLSGGGGSAAAASATVKYKVQSITMTNKGAGYSSSPTVSFAGGSGTSAAALANFRNQCCVPVDALGGYHAAASHTGYNSASTDLLVTSLGTTITNTSIAMSPATGFTCNRDSCCPNSDQPGPPFAIITFPTSLTANDGLGDIALTGSRSAGWEGYATRTASQGQPVCPDAGHPDPVYVANVDVPILIRFNCAAGGLSIATNTCNDVVSGGTAFCDPSFPSPGANDVTTWCGGGGGAVGVAVTPTVTTCLPMTVTGAFGPGAFATLPNQLQAIYGTGDFNVTISA